MSDQKKKLDPEFVRLSAAMFGGMKPDQPKPASVYEAKREVQAWTFPCHDFDTALDTLIAAVERRERERVLAEFRMLAEKILAVEIDGYYSCGKKDAADEFISLIQSIETPNKKP